MLENELTFLIKKIPKDLENYPKKEIKQGYFSGFPSPLRIRNEDDKVFTLTKKTKINEDDSSRFNETTIVIKKEEFDILWLVCKKKMAKTRYFYPLQGLTAEVDIFKGRLNGLKMVEVEFSNEKKREEFNPPEWFGEDITQKSWAANSVLANFSYKKLLLMINKD